MRASALPYAAAFESQILPPVPRELSDRIAALASADSRRRHAGRSAWPKLVTAFAAGVLCCTIALKLLSFGVTGLSATAQVEPWIQAVADYQQLYSRATVTHVTEDPQLTARVISDLWTADGMRVVVPDLRASGLTFKRVQRLSFREQPVVQMVYLPEQGVPVALCVRDFLDRVLKAALRQWQHAAQLTVPPCDGAQFANLLRVRLLVGARIPCDAERNRLPLLGQIHHLHDRLLAEAQPLYPFESQPGTTQVRHDHSHAISGP